MSAAPRTIFQIQSPPSSFVELFEVVSSYFLFLHHTPVLAVYSLFFRQPGVTWNCRGSHGFLVSGVLVLNTLVYSHRNKLDVFVLLFIFCR